MSDGDSRPGGTVEVDGGVRAFVPDPLPPEIQWTPRLVRALSEADQLVGRLAGEGRRLPNPHLLIRPFVRREAVLSSRIEGTQATLGELLAAEAGAHVQRSPDDLREVGNYVVALERGVAQFGSGPLSLERVLELHAVLMKGVRGGYAAPGRIRSEQVWIGPRGCTAAQATYVPPPPAKILPCLERWAEFLTDQTLPPLVQAALLHYQFEAIHPFLDGNGRIGRLVIILFLIERAVLPSPLLYLSAFFEATRTDYYDSLRAVQQRGAWQDWILYFLGGVARQAEDALDRAERINSLLDRWREKLAAASSPNAAKALLLLAGNPFLTVKHLAERLKVSFPTAERAVDILLAEQIVRQTSAGRRNRVFCAQALLGILEEPAHVDPWKRGN